MFAGEEILALRTLTFPARIFGLEVPEDAL
jgi:hypothetical protein